ncbi:hypothetical protein I3760_09G024000 [Carya illinoinensis]|uniref:VQ domain-containing protein n=1 Tax=Carya illinoinensis TaxID=32201 RepID=A0A922DZM0_CARIL|nr:hypothetical protein I3760_09G024000 [Carya illinoinensis]KAG6693913.1 hypothetical protein I3842_09G024400 [Carya illinoinensis]
MSPKTKTQLQGPGAALLAVSKSSTKIIKKPPPSRRTSSPVITYLQPPEVIHVRPEEFLSTVQRLTGNQSSTYIRWTRGDINEAQRLI